MVQKNNTGVGSSCKKAYRDARRGAVPRSKTIHYEDSELRTVEHANETLLQRWEHLTTDNLEEIALPSLSDIKTCIGYLKRSL